MLTSDLLVTRISGGKIKPVYAAFDSENLELARLLIETFEQHIEKTYGDLLSELDGYEEMNYRFIRGLSQLLGRRTVIETDAAVDPSLAREAVFEACGGMALSPAERKEALQKASKKLSISIRELEKALWADLEENQVVKSFLPLSPAELLRQYNISLTQTLLFRAIDLDIWIKGDFQKILWKILRFGLMYTLEDTYEEKSRINNKKEKLKGKPKENKEELKAVHLHLDGPASLFRISERYGNSFAKIFPALLRSKGWRLKASILHKSYQGKRILDFTLEDSEEAFKLMPEAALHPGTFSQEFKIEEEKGRYETGKEIIGKGKAWKEEAIEKEGKEKEVEFLEKEAEIEESDSDEAAYDSMLEQRFGSLSLGSWKIKREPTILKAGKYAFVPDFVLQRESIKVYLEIVGFWTPEYLQKKIEKLKQVKEPVILLIDRKLKCSEKDFPSQEVIFFDKQIPTKKVMQILRKYEEKKLLEDRSKLEEMEFPLSGELVSLEKIAAGKGVLPDALTKVIADRLMKAEELEKARHSEKDSELEKAEELGKFEDLEKYRDYVLLENYLIHRKLLKKIDLELEKPGGVKTYADAVKVFQGFELDRSLYYPVLDYLGYKVIWTGLSEEDARVEKVNKMT